MSTKPLGRFCWYDLMTPDPDGATAFYARVAGWGTSPFEAGGQPYTMWMNGATPLGGVMHLPEDAAADGTPPHWLPYVSTPNQQRTADRAAELGGEILAEIDIATVGSVGILSDPQGGVFAAFEPLEEAPGHDGPGTVGEFSWHELYTEDAESALAFYAELFGWEPTETMDMGGGRIYRMYGRNGQTLGGMMSRTPEMPELSWLLYLRVPDIDAGVAAVTEAGGEVWNGPIEVPGGDRVAHCRDPQGTMFALHSAAQG